MLRNQELEERVAALEAQRQQTPPTPPMDFQPTGMPSLWQGRVSSSLPIPGTFHWRYVLHHVSRGMSLKRIRNHNNP